jgi:hypothetical protein
MSTKIGKLQSDIHKIACNKTITLDLGAEESTASTGADGASTSKQALEMSHFKLNVKNEMDSVHSEHSKMSAKYNSLFEEVVRLGKQQESFQEGMVNLTKQINNKFSHI